MKTQSWTIEENARLARGVAEGKNLNELWKLFPGSTKDCVRAKAWTHGWSAAPRDDEEARRIAARREMETAAEKRLAARYERLRAERKRRLEHSKNTNW